MKWINHLAEVMRTRCTIGASWCRLTFCQWHFWKVHLGWQPWRGATWKWYSPWSRGFAFVVSFWIMLSSIARKIWMQFMKLIMYQSPAQIYMLNSTKRPGHMLMWTENGVQEEEGTKEGCCETRKRNNVFIDCSCDIEDSGTQKAVFVVLSDFLCHVKENLNSCTDFYHNWSLYVVNIPLDRQISAWLWCTVATRVFSEREHLIWGGILDFMLVV